MLFKGFIMCAVFSLMLFCGASAQTNGSSPAAGLTRCSLRDVDAPLRGILISDSDNIYLGTANGTLSSYEVKNLGIIWRSELGGEFASELLLVGSGIIAVTNSTSTGNGTQESSAIRLIGKDSGVTAWSAKLAFSDRYYLGRLNGGIAAVSRQGSVALLDIASGQVKWQTGLHGTVSVKPAFSAGRMAFGTADKQVLVMSAGDGGLLHRLQLDFAPTAISFSKNGGLLIGDERGNVTLFGAGDNKAVWKFKSGAAVSSVVEADEGILITSLDNFVYFISDNNADVIWKRRLPGRLVEGGLMMNGYLIALIYGENSGYVLDLESGKLIDVIQPGANDLISRSPVFVRRGMFALTTANSLETYSVGPCGPK